MLFIQNTSNNTGVAIYGDYMDFENLYEALHEVVGEEDEFVGYDGARIRILGVCYDLRHALMGDRKYEFVDNGLDEEKKRRMSVLASDKNLYFRIEVLWPEMLFVTIALNEFLKLYARKHIKAKYSADLFSENKIIWDKNIAQVRMLQSALSECLKQTISEHAYARMHNIMNGSYVYFNRYLTQYLDILNVRFMEMNKEKRLKNISTTAKRIVEKNNEYRHLEDQIREEARRLKCGVNDLRLDLDYPEEIDW